MPFHFHLVHTSCYLRALEYKMELCHITNVTNISRLKDEESTQHYTAVLACDEYQNKFFISTGVFNATVNRKGRGRCVIR